MQHTMSSTCFSKVNHHQRFYVDDNNNDNDNNKLSTSSTSIATAIGIAIRSNKHFLPELLRTPSKKKQKVHNNDVASFRFWIALPESIRVDILNYAGDNKQQEELRNLVLVSKGFNEDCKRSGIEWTISTLLILSPLYSPVCDKRDRGSTRKFIQEINHHLRNNDNNNDMDIQRFCRMRVNDANKFDSMPCDELREFIAENNIRMDGIDSLDLSLPSETSETDLVFRPFYNYIDKLPFPITLSLILPNLRVLDLSNWNAPLFYRVLKDISRQCQRLEQIIWNNIKRCSHVNVDGESMASSSKLREIIMDDSTFHCFDFEEDRLSDLDNYPDTFLFNKCCKVLERLSLRNATICQYHMFGIIKIVKIPQNALIKFVRKAPPTLRWFRSDLNNENMWMLKKERPDIEFLN